MRYLAVFLFAGLVHGRGGLPARSAPDSYPAQAQGRGFIVAAEVMSPEQVRNEFSTTLTPMYQVLEVAVFPAQGSTVDVIALDFAVRVDGRLIRPAAPGTIAMRNQKKAAAGGKDVVLWPSAGVSTGTWGTGAGVGVGVGVANGRPGPGSTDRDRRTMESELDDRGFQDALLDKPAAGYLYFPVGETKSRTMELIYQYDKGEVRVPVDIPKTK